MHVKNTTTKDDLKKRLKRIEGQVRGISKMVDEDRDCRELIQQLAAVRSAVQQANLLLVRSYACQCIEAPEGENQQEALDELISVLSKAS